MGNPERVESPERCSRVKKQERSSLNEKPEACSRMETSERSSRVGRVERGRKDRAKKGRAGVHVRAVYNYKNAKKGRAPKQLRSPEPQERRGDEGKTNGGSGAGWGAGGGLTVNLKLGCA